MDTKVAREVLSLIRAEEHSRRIELQSEDPDYAYDRWLFTDQPFVSDLCLALLLAVRHEVERTLVVYAARAAKGGRDFSSKEDFRDALKQARKTFLRDGLAAELKLQSSPEWEAMEALRLLVNSYKHNPWAGPSPQLVKHLGLSEVRNYAPLPESDALRKGLAAFLGLSAEAGYSDITEDLLSRVDRFLDEIPRKIELGRPPLLSLIDLVE